MRLCCNSVDVTQVTGLKPGTCPQSETSRATRRSLMGIDALDQLCLSKMIKVKSRVRLWSVSSSWKNSCKTSGCKYVMWHNSHVWWNDMTSLHHIPRVCTLAGQPQLSITPQSFERIPSNEMSQSLKATVIKCEIAPSERLSCWKSNSPPQVWSSGKIKVQSVLWTDYLIGPCPSKFGFR